MSHKALARKHRPRSFAQVATQEHVSETLRRAVASDRVGHAYLFCGPRGVGKTTLARVLAMALNCPDRTAEGEPCGVCESCTRIWGGHTALDVVEIDAASNRGVDDARDLRERAMYAPSAEGRTKVYIVDEAHMLTREAWNALLKILEEPPPRVIFVFATTEPQKIQQAAAPILSRCQRFDFRRIGVSDIVRQLTMVLADEQVEAPEEALRAIARKADGGMRDALSLLDQVLSLTGGDVDLDSVRRVLGLVEEERYVELLDIIRERRHDAVFSLVQELVDEGYDLVEFYHGLLEILRLALRLRLSSDAELDVQDDVRAQLSDRVQDFSPGDLVRMLSAASELETQGGLRRSPNPRLPIEMLLLRMSFLDRTVSFEALISALGGAPLPDGEGGAPSGGAGGPSAEPAGSSDAQRGAAPTGAAPRADASPVSPPPGASAQGTDERSPAETLREAVLRASEEVQPPADELAELPEREAPIVPSDDPLEGWTRWVDSGRGVPSGLTTFLRTAKVEPTPDGLTIVPQAGPASERMGSRAVVEAMTEALTPFVGRRLKLVVAEPEDGAGLKPRITQEDARNDTLKALYRQEPRLRRAVEELDLELMD